MILKEYSKEVYQYFLTNGCINYYDVSKIKLFTNKHILELKQLLNSEMLIIEEKDFSPFVALNESNICKVDNIDDFELNKNVLDENIKNNIKRFRKERNSFLKYVFKNTVIEQTNLCEKFGNLALQKYSVYIRTCGFSTLNLISLSPIGYKVLNENFDLNEIDYNILCYVGKNNIKLKSKKSFFPQIIKDIMYLKNNLFMIYNQNNDSENKKILKMKNFKLIDIIYGYDSNIIYLTEKGIEFSRIICSVNNIEYNTYIKMIDIKLYEAFKEKYIPFQESLVINKLLENKFLSKKEINVYSENFKKFLAQYSYEIEAFGNVYVYLNNKFYAKNKLINEYNIFNCVIDAIKKDEVNLLENITFFEVKQIVCNVFEIDSSIEYNTTNIPKADFIFKFKNNTKYRYAFEIAVLYLIGIINFMEIGNESYVILNKQGFDFLGISVSENEEKKLLKKTMEVNSYTPVLNDIYNKKFVSKTELEKMYGKNILNKIGDFIEVFSLNDYTYIELNKLGCVMIKKKYRFNKGVVVALPKKFNIKKDVKLKDIECICKTDNSNILDDADRYLLQFIYTNKLVRHSDLELFSSIRLKKLIAIDYIKVYSKRRYLLLTELGCDYINGVYYNVSKNQVLAISKKERTAKSYFLRKQFAKDIINLLKESAVYDKEHLLKRCNSFLDNTSLKLDSEYSKDMFSLDEEKILFTMYTQNLYIDKFSLDSETYDKFKRFNYIKYCRDTRYIKLTKNYNERIFLSDLFQIKSLNLDKVKNNNFSYIKNTSIIADKNVDKFKRIRKITNIEITSSKGKKSLSKKLYANDVEFLFDGVNKDNINKHIDFLKNGKYIIFDTEFGSEYGNHSNMIEISAIKVNGLEIIDRMDLLVKDHKRSLSRKVRELTNIDKGLLVKNGVSEKFALTKFIEFIEDLPVMAHAAENDWHSCVLLGCDNNGIDFPKNKLIDSFELLSKIYPKEKCGLDFMISKFNLKKMDIPRHRALGDSIYTLEVIKKAIASYGKKEFLNYIIK